MNRAAEQGFPIVTIAARINLWRLISGRPVEDPVEDFVVDIGEFDAALYERRN
jgi:hypothetical protein